MFIRYDEIFEDHGILSYVKPFSRQLWLALFFCITTIGGFTLIFASKNSSDFGILNACYHPIESFTNQGNEVKIIYISHLWAGVAESLEINLRILHFERGLKLSGTFLNCPARIFVPKTGLSLKNLTSPYHNLPRT